MPFVLVGGVHFETFPILLITHNTALYIVLHVQSSLSSVCGEVQVFQKYIFQNGLEEQGDLSVGIELQAVL